MHSLIAFALRTAALQLRVGIGRSHGCVLRYTVVPGGDATTEHQALCFLGSEEP